MHERPTLTARRTERPSAELRRRRHRPREASRAGSASPGVQNRQHCAAGAPALRISSGRCASHLTWETHQRINAFWLFCVLLCAPVFFWNIST